MTVIWVYKMFFNDAKLLKCDLLRYYIEKILIDPRTREFGRIVLKCLLNIKFVWSCEHSLLGDTLSTFEGRVTRLYKYMYPMEQHRGSVIISYSLDTVHLPRILAAVEVSLSLSLRFRVSLSVSLYSSVGSLCYIVLGSVAF